MDPSREPRVQPTIGGLARPSVTSPSPAPTIAQPIRPTSTGAGSTSDGVAPSAIAGAIATGTPLATPEPAAAIAYDDFANLTSGWAPLYIDDASNFNGYSEGTYLFNALSPNALLYDVRNTPGFVPGRYAIDLHYSRGDGAFGLMVDVQGDPNHFESLSYYSIGLTTQGAVVVQRREATTGDVSTLVETPASTVHLDTTRVTRLGVDVGPDGIQVLIDGTEVLRASGVQVQGGFVGLFAASRSQPLSVAFDNLLILARAPAVQQACADIRSLFVTPPGTARIQGDDVRILQQRLIRLGYDVGESDGIFGPLAESAVVQFQRRNSLAPDGIVGPQTWCQLLSGDTAMSQDGRAESLAEQQSYRPVAISSAAGLSAPLFVSVRQVDKSWRIALALPGRTDLQYIETEGDAFDPAWSPDKRFLAFTSERSGSAAIWLLDFGSGELRPITPPDLECQFPTWAPDSHTLIYTAEPQANQPLAARDNLLDLATGQTRRLSEEQAGWADWSISNEIVFTHWTGKSFDLFRVNPDGSGLTNLSNTDNLDEDVPAWSPDGTQIAFVGNPRGDPSQRQVFLMQHDGSAVRQITTMQGPNSNPIWSPDGQTIAFANQPTNEIRQPWLVAATGENLRQLSANDDRIWFMNWVRPR
ncbi:MAG: peptidoglycan-binding protein [Roseiflexaceae bacterium]